MTLYDLTGPAADAADRLLALAKDVPLAGVERSCKFSAGRLDSNRLLLAQAPDLLAGTPLAEAHVSLGMPEHARADFERDLARANFVYLGFEGAAERLTYRIYLEFSVRLGPAQASMPAQAAPVLLARGYKWDALSSDRPLVATSEYWWTPQLTASQIVKRLAELTPPGGDSANTLVLAAIDAARSRSNALDWTWLEVQEPGSPRQSHDLNLYEAQLRLDELAPSLQATAQRFSIDHACFERWLAHAGADTVGHVSGGLGRDGQPFVTVYHAT